MSIQIVDVSGCKRNLVVEIPAEEVDEEVEKLAQDYAHKVKVPGFRPGRVPVNIIKQRFGTELRNDATQDLIRRSWKDALSEHDLAPLAEPVVEDVHDEPGNPLRFTLSFEVLPKLEIKEYKGVTVQVTSSEVTDTTVEETLEKLRDQQAQYVPVEREARDGDLVGVKIDGEPEGGGKPIHDDDLTFIIGAPDTHEAFSANLRGARAGETRFFEAAYPENYGRKELAGKKVRYALTVNEVKEKHVSELEDFAKDVGYSGIEELRSKVRDDLVTRAERTAEKNAKEAVLDEVVRRNPMDIPECLVKEELSQNARRMASTLAREGYDLQRTKIDWHKVFEQEKPNAEQAVRRSIVLDAIARQESLEVTDEELEAEFQKLAEGSNKSAAAIRAQFEKDERIQSFREHLLNNKALDFVYRNANISRG